jgi:hypothetical protein
MVGDDPVSADNVRDWSASFNIPATMKLLLRLQASIGMIHCLDYRGTHDINRRLTGIVNNMGDMWNHGQAMWNANPANKHSQATVGYFWSK